MVRESTRIALVVLGLLAGSTQSAGCGHCNEPEPAFPTTGTYSLALDSDAELDEEWLVLAGSELVVNRGAEVAALRYARDGVTYEVRFELLIQPFPPE